MAKNQTLLQMEGPTKLSSQSMRIAKSGFNIVSVKTEPATGFPILYARFSMMKEDRKTFVAPSSETSVAHNDQPRAVRIGSPSASTRANETWKPNFLLDLEEGTDYYDSEEL